MDNESLALKLQEAIDRSLRNEGRIKKLEMENQVLHDLGTSVAVMAEQLKTMNTNLNSLDKKVDDLESKPAKRWDSLISAVVGAAAGAFLAWLFSGAPGL